MIFYDRESEGDGCPVIRSTLETYIAAMLAHDPTDDRQAQTCTRSSFLVRGAKKGFKDEWQRIFGNTGALITDSYLDFPMLVPYTDSHGAVRGGPGAGRIQAAGAMGVAIGQ